MKKLTPIENIDVNYNQLILNILDALSYLEVNDIIHNDVKPWNILYDPDTQQYVLIDFGVSTRFKICHTARVNRPITEAPEITYRNLLPDQKINLPAIVDTDDNRSDTFGLGATLFILLTGKSWFPNEEDKLKISFSQSYLSLLDGNPYQPLVKEMMTPFPQNRPLPSQLAKRFGIEKAYLKIREPVVQIPEGWTSREIESVRKLLPSR